MLRSASRFVALALALVATGAHAQITVTPRGDAAVLDIAAWNLEFFGEPTQGPSDALQAERVQAVLERAGIDLWALEEVVSTTGFAALTAGIADDGYATILGPNVNSDPVYNQRLAFVYNTSVVTPLGPITTPVPGTNFGGRAPIELRATVTLGGVAREMRFIAIHAKASSDGASYDKRVAGAAQLKTYLDGLVAQGAAVVVMGDFNDELTRSIAGSTRTSPYAAFLADANYTFATLALEQANLPTFCGSNNTCGVSSSASTIDHILLAGGARTAYVAGSGDRYAELLTGITQYTQTTSDHLPVLARLTVTATAGEAGPDDRRLALLPAAPNPFRTGTALRFVLGEASDVQVEVTDVLGRTVATLGGTYGAGDHQIALDGAGLAAGLYRVRLRAGGTERVQTVIRAR